jgi:aminomethyltransferase
MGYCLYGNDIDETTNPIEAGLGWITKLGKESFNAKDVLQKEKEEKPKRKLVGFEMQERAIPRQHYRIFAEGRDVGEVTSGTSSPTLGKGIGMGYVESAYSKPGTAISIMIRDKEVPAVVARPPFVKKQG